LSQIVAGPSKPGALWENVLASEADLAHSLVRLHGAAAREVAAQHARTNEGSDDRAALERWQRIAAKMNDIIARK